MIKIIIMRMKLIKILKMIILVIKTKKEKTSMKKKRERKIVRPQELPWPENLITEIGLEYAFPETKEYVNLNDDQMEGLAYVMDQLSDRERVVLLLRYKEHKTLDDTAIYFNVTNVRIRQIIAKSIRKLRHESRIPYYRDGYQATLDKREKTREKILTDLGEQIRETSLDKLNLSVRTYNCLKRAGYTTLGDLAVTDPKKIKDVRDLGTKSFAELQEILQGYGIWKKADDAVEHTAK